MERLPESSWHLDKRVPLGLIIGLSINALCGIWYASKLDSRVEMLEARMIVLVTDVVKFRDAMDSGKERMIRLEEKLENILSELKRLEASVSRNERRAPIDK